MNLITISKENLKLRDGDVIGLNAGIHPDDIIPGNIALVRFIDTGNQFVEIIGVIKSPHGWCYCDVRQKNGQFNTVRLGLIVRIASPLEAMAFIGGIRKDE